MRISCAINAICFWFEKYLFLSGVLIGKWVGTQRERLNHYLPTQVPTRGYAVEQFAYSDCYLMILTTLDVHINLMLAVSNTWKSNLEKYSTFIRVNVILDMSMKRHKVYTTPC